jgi:hypothetical protein
MKKELHFKQYYISKITIFWDITTCSLLKVNRRFGEKYRIHPQVQKDCFLAGLFFDPED